MRKHMAIVAAASLAVAGISFTGLSHAQDDFGIGQQPEQQQQQDQFGQPGHVGLDVGIGADAQLPAGAIQAEDEQAKEDIKNAITEVTQAALEADNGFGNLLEHLSQADRERLRELEDRDAEQLREQISQLRDAYQEKYDQELAFETEQVFTEEVQVVQGEVVSPAILIRWPVEPTQERDRLHEPGLEQPGMEQPGFEQPGMRQDQDRQPGEFGTEGDQQPGQFQFQLDQPGMGEEPAAREPGIGIGQERPDVGDRLAEREHELEAGDKIAVVSFPERDQLPAITVSLVQEDDQWKLNLPEQVDAQTIEQNLTQGLQKVHEQRDQWPEDAQKASAKLTQVVMMALYDVQPDAARDHMQPGEMHQPADPGMGTLPEQQDQTGEQQQPGQIGY